MATVGRDAHIARSAFAALALAVSHPTPVLACEDAVAIISGNGTEEQMLNPPIDARPDCSFDDSIFGGYWNASARAHYAIEFYLGAEPARDRGNGRVGQRIIDGKGCSSIEKLLVLDCGSGEAVMIDGVQPPELANSNVEVRKIELIQAPLGPISVTDNTQVGELIGIADRNGLTVTTDVGGFFAKRGKDSFDYTCGCKLFYPGSPGAGGAGG